MASHRPLVCVAMTPSAQIGGLCRVGTQHAGSDTRGLHLAYLFLAGDLASLHHRHTGNAADSVKATLLGGGGGGKLASMVSASARQAIGSAAKRHG